MKSLLFIASIAVLSVTVEALHLSLNGKRHAQSLARRSPISGSSNLTDSLDIQYSTNITLGGLPFSVLIDTGSSDLWVASAGLIPGATNTGATSGVQYAVGEVQGPIELGTLVFAGYTINDQAFLLVAPDSNNPAASGLIGLGPSSGSNILQTLNTSSGNPPLDNIFIQDTNTPNYLSILLGRTDDPNNVFPGDLTVGETLPGYDAVLQQPKLAVSVVSLQNAGGQHWQTLLDQNGAIGADGKPISVTSSVTGTTTPNQATVVFDSGFSLPQVPSNVAKAFYSSFNGAELTNITGLGQVWILPCTAEVNVSFKFSGNSFPVHPLDATLEPSALGLNELQNSEGTNACIGSFQPVSFDSQGLFDMILGMAFLRNAYLLINFGDFIDGSIGKAAPYIQLLSTTNNSAQAHTDFVAARLNNSTTASGDGRSGSNNDGGSNGGTTSSNSRYIGIAVGFCALSLFLGAIIYCFQRRRRMRYQTAVAQSWSYAPLGAPAPSAAMEMQIPPPGQQPYGQQYNSQYHPPYNPPYSQPYGEPWAPPQ